jgi:hypothetical protein
MAGSHKTAVAPVKLESYLIRVEGHFAQVWGLPDNASTRSSPALEGFPSLKKKTLNIQRKNNSYSV